MAANKEGPLRDCYLGVGKLAVSGARSVEPVHPAMKAFIARVKPQLQSDTEKARLMRGASDEQTFTNERIKTLKSLRFERQRLEQIPEKAKPDSLTHQVGEFLPQLDDAKFGDRIRANAHYQLAVLDYRACPELRRLTKFDHLAAASRIANRRLLVHCRLTMRREATYSHLLAVQRPSSFGVRCDRRDDCVPASVVSKVLSACFIGSSHG